MLAIDRFSSIPVYEQIINAVERDIATGALKEGDKLPSVREMATTLVVNPNTVQKAYTELQSRYIIVTVASSGAFVAKNATDRVKAHKSELIEKIRESLLELRYAGIDESVIINEVRSVFASSVTSNAPAIDISTPTKAKKAPAQKKQPTQKKIVEEPKKEQEAEKTTPPPTRRKMGIELL